MLCLGLDTSNYTTSLALADEQEQIIYEDHKLLTVKEGERGLRQSEALYQHVVNLPVMMQKIPKEISLKKEVAVIAVSDKPRPQEDSYMPVFRAGILLAESLGRAFEVPVVRVSHQENHLRAALYGCGLTDKEVAFPLIGTHFSGGTSEILLATYRPGGYDCKIVGKTLDLNAGQLIDRIGVAMGYAFPAGRSIEALAQKALQRDCVIPSRVEGYDFHFSGQENKALSLLASGTAQEEVAFGLLRSVAKTLSKTIGPLGKESGARDVVFSGGVMSNGIIRQIVEKELSRSGLRLHFTTPECAADNARGTALLGIRAVKEAIG